MRSMTVRVLLALGAVAVSLGGTPGTAHADGVGMSPYFIEYGTGMSTYVGQAAATKVPIGVQAWGQGSATGLKLTVDLSQITAEVDVVAVSSPCRVSGSTVTCDFGTLKVAGSGKVNALLSLRAKPDAEAGPAGTVKLKLTGSPTPTDPTASGTVDVRHDVADLALSSTVPTAQIGQTVTVVHTVRNLGPGDTSWLNLGAGQAQPGTRYVGGDGCTTTATTYLCELKDIAAGQTRTVRVRVKVDGCDKSLGTLSPGEGWATSLSDPVSSNDDYRMLVKVAGCAGPTGTSGSGSGSGSSGGGTRPQATPSASASASPSPSPSPSAPATASPSTAAAPTTVLAADTGGDGSLRLWLWLTAGLVLLAGLGVWWRARTGPLPQ